MIGDETSWQVDKNDENTAYLFNLGAESCLSLEPHYNTRLVQRNLSQQIARSPNNLRIHCQRILLAVKNEDRIYLSGYLQDLFIVLGDSGKALRLRMLGVSRPFLNLQRKTEFDQWLEQGKAHEAFQCRANGSILSSAYLGELLVKKKKQTITKHVTNSAPIKTEQRLVKDILEEARSYLEYGQIDEAREVLEETILTKQVVDAELEDELLNIYYYTRDADALKQMSNKIKKQGNEPSEAWKAMEKIASAWSS